MGRMIEPPMRSSMWRYGFNTPKNYQDDLLHCGGYQRYIANNERCGTCGDPYDGVRHNEAGGQYATGIVGRYFSLSDTHIPVTIELTGSYRGKFEFRLCPHNRVNEPVTQVCLDRYPLIIEEGVSLGTPYSFEPNTSGTYNLTVQIPDGMFCTQCVLQWKYKADNSLGIRPKNTECTGCNFRENFQNCADVSIGYYPEILPNVPVTKPSDHWTDQIKHLLQPDAYKFNSNGTENVIPFTKNTSNRSLILLSTIPPPPLPIMSTIPSPLFPLISTIPPPPFPIMSTIPPPPFPIMSTSSKKEMKSEHLFKIQPPPRTIFSERVDGIVTNKSKDISLHHSHTNINIVPKHLNLLQNLHSNSEISAVSKQNDTVTKNGSISTTAHQNKFTTKNLEINIDKRIADNLYLSQAQASDAQSSSNVMIVNSSSIIDSANNQINTSRESLDDIEARIAIAELILADQLIAQEAGQNNTAHIENDLKTMKTKIVSLEDKLKKMENNLRKVATDLTRVKLLTSPVKSSRKEIFRRIGLGFRFQKAETTTVTTPAWHMKKKIVGKAVEFSNNVNKDKNVINKVQNIILGKVITDLGSNINSVSQNESIPEASTTENIDTWKIATQPTLTSNDRVNPADGMSLDINTTRPLAPVRQITLELNGKHEPQKSQSNSHPSSSTIKSTLDLNKHIPAESLPLLSSAASANALDLGRSIIDARNTGRLAELTVLQQPVQASSSRQLNSNQNIGIQEIQGVDIQNRDIIVLHRDMNSASSSNGHGSMTFDSSGSATLSSRTRVMTNSSVQRTAEQVIAIPNKNMGSVSVSSRGTQELSARPQWQMIRSAQDVINLRSRTENSETNNIQNLAPSVNSFLNSGSGSSSAMQTNALFSRGLIQQLQQQREQINVQQLHSQQHAQQQVQRSSASLHPAFLNTATNRARQVPTPLVRQFQPRTFVSQGQIIPNLPVQNRFVSQQFGAINTNEPGTINSQSQQHTMASMQPITFFPIAGILSG
ncbi:hypothetical protein CHS0354_003457 [Potamilus streckersoni]|uniref:Chitin-binding type-4 domain-containing protein n=1 Tax=Potamilus streckersoni TaxID=2493646 RepID=A0AAE0SP79_9BIVA|nr:hypothetical protein CHS0354_003457 [Potamilus streckersoni]